MQAGTCAFTYKLYGQAQQATPTATVGTPTATVGTPTATVGTPTATVGTPTAPLEQRFYLPVILQ